MDLTAPVHTLMTPAPVTVPADASLTDAWTAMVNGGFHHLLVCNEGDLVGILSAADVMRVLGPLDPVLQDTGVVLDTEHTVADLMSADVVAVEDGATLHEAVGLLSRGDFHALPVLRRGALVGIVTSTDVLRKVLTSAGVA